MALHGKLRSHQSQQETVLWKPLGLFHWHIWLQWAKPCCANLLFHYQFNRAELHSRWTTSGVGPKGACPASKQATTRSCQPQPTCDNPPFYTSNKHVLRDSPNIRAGDQRERCFLKCLGSALSIFEPGRQMCMGKPHMNICIKFCAGQSSRS